MNSNMIEIRNLSKKFHRQQVLKNITMTIPCGCVYGLLGANGAGKSTLLKTITGILMPSSGQIYFHGHEWSRKDLADIGALIESPPVYENLTAQENMKVKALLLSAENTADKRSHKDRQRKPFQMADKHIEDILKVVGLADTGRKKAGTFSLGMKQRLGIALALLGNPKLLVLDEPTNGLDPMGIRELRQLIRSFPEKGITVIISSHILSEIQQTADYIGIMADGELGFEGRMEGHENLEELFMKIAAKRRENR